MSGWLARIDYHFAGIPKMFCAFDISLHLAIHSIFSAFSFSCAFILGWQL